MEKLKNIIKEISEFGEMNELQIDQYYEIILDVVRPTPKDKEAI